MRNEAYNFIICNGASVANSSNNGYVPQNSTAGEVIVRVMERTLEEPLIQRNVPSQAASAIKQTAGGHDLYPRGYKLSLKYGFERPELQAC
jgi:hypothetical protein